MSATTNEKWEIGDAKVRVAIVCALAPEIHARTGMPLLLNGREVDTINRDLTSGIDVTKAQKLASNLRVAFQGVKLTGPFDIRGVEAREMLAAPSNPNGRRNADVLRRLFDIDDITDRDSDRWVVDFGTKLDARSAALFEAPFRIVADRVVPYRKGPEKAPRSEKRLYSRFWEFERPRPELRKAIAGRSRLIMTPESSEHRLFVFAPTTVLPQGSLFVINRDDDVSFGILHSRVHEVWSTAQGNRLGVGNQRRYNIGVTFETFPFPEGLTPDIRASEYADDPRAAAIGSAAAELDRLREAWLHPAELVRREPEIVEGFPDRIVPVDGKAAAQLVERTLNELYNSRPPWLVDAHAAVDAAVAEAYEWPTDLTDQEILERLLDLNLARPVRTSKSRRPSNPTFQSSGRRPTRGR